ncbi:collagenase [Nonomuraea sediminis]|uniref:collagenase n=1 Tax=Nonomuraea sediminis TaxID=2835864 RepID=UPI001BDBDD4D|nr:collagenase [Nonomuraea sediminis]
MSSRRLVVLLLTAIALVLAGVSTPALASPPAQPKPDGRQVSGATKVADPHVLDAVNQRQHAAEREPLISPAENAPKALLKAQAAACSVSDFTGNTGNALVAAIKAASVSCINSLFSVTGSDQYNAFREAQMITVANALRSDAASYNGTNATSTEQLVLYLRAGYYIQFYNPDTVPAYSSALTSAVEGALDTFYANSHAYDVTDANGEVLGEAVILIDSASENARYLSVVKRLLDSYTNAYNSLWYMRNAVNDTFTVLFRGEWAPGYPAAVQADPSIVDSVYNFASRHLDLLGGDSAFLDVNAGGELTRFVQYAGLQAKVRPLAKWLLDNSGITGTRAALWVRVAVVANDKDSSNCSYYGTCDLANRVKAAVLTQNYTCSQGVLHIVAQQMTTQEFQDACASMLNENSYFHNLVQDGSRPVADDYNTNMEVVAFASSADYQNYAGVIYGIDTNNGGMYLEGDPSKQGNQPRFIAYQSSGDNGFAARIWNLNHEYSHYLDGRYNTYGDFTAETVKPNIWWIEGSAEYVSYSYRNLAYTAALNEAPKHTYTLSTLFDTTYANTDVNRTYHWGYLAVRYMFEKHRSDLTRLLGYYRTGDYTGAYNFTKSLNYNGDFTAWLDTLSGGTGNKPPTASFTVNTSGLTATFADTSTDPDGSIAARSWTFGDGASSTSANPAHTYTAAGTYTVTLKVTDNAGATATTSKTVTVSSSSLPTCPGSDTRVMDKNCQRANVSATNVNYAYFYIWIPSGTTSLTITVSGGSGNADLYFNPNAWATTGAYTARSTNSGNSETLTVTNLRANNYNYISLYAVTDFSGVTISTRY